MKKTKSRVAAPRFVVDDSTLCVPPRTLSAFNSLDAVRRAFSLPVSLGTTPENRHAADMVFDAAGGYETIYTSLAQHSSELGQFPVTSFIGYGALQNIAQNGMIQACINSVSDDLTREWIRVTGGNWADDSEREEFVRSLDSKYNLRAVFHESAVTTGYFGGSFIYIDTGVDDGLEYPLVLSDISAEITKGGSLSFRVIDPVNVSPCAYNATNPLRSDYMRPTQWWVLGRKVHASRLLPVIDNQPPVLLRPSYNFLGIPQAQILWDYVAHFNQNRVAASKLLQKVSLLVMKTDMATIYAANGVSAFDQRMRVMERYRNNDSVVAIDANDEDICNVQTSLSGCTDVVRQSLELIAAINRTPATKLLGISPAGFNATGESDLANYYDHVRALQELRRKPLEQCLKAIQLAEFGSIDPTIGFEFEPLGRADEQAKAATAKAKADTWALLADRQAINSEELRHAAKADPDIGLGFIDDEMPDLDPQEFLGETFPDIASKPAAPSPVVKPDAEAADDPGD